MNKSTKSAARNRWILLQKAILTHSVPKPKDNPVSKRGFEKYSAFIDWTTTTDTEYSVINVSIKVFGKPYALQVYRRNDADNVDIGDLRGFDKTGRICIWPAEQILTYWCLQHYHLFQGKNVIEIGGGFSNLASLAIAKYTKAQHVVLTDGDPSNIAGAVRTLKNNCLICPKVYASLVRWDDFNNSDLKGKFDYVLAADVVYDSHFTLSLLVETVAKLLKPDGEFVLFNPTRVSKLDEFLTIAKNSGLFRQVSVSSDYDAVITKVRCELSQNNPSFQPEWHYPIQLRFRK